MILNILTMMLSVALIVSLGGLSMCAMIWLIERGLK